MDDIKHKLIGDIKSDLTDPEAIQDFFIELETLMLRYRVDKIDVAWRRFNRPL